MKKLLLVATLSITVAAVIKRVAGSFYKISRELQGFKREYRALKKLTSMT